MKEAGAVIVSGKHFFHARNASVLPGKPIINPPVFYPGELDFRDGTIAGFLIFAW